jgi:hypothetical protein
MRPETTQGNTCVPLIAAIRENRKVREIDAETHANLIHSPLIGKVAKR